MGLLAEEVAQDPLGDVAQVARALPQVLVVDLVEGLDVALGDIVEARLDIRAGVFELASKIRASSGPRLCSTSFLILVICWRVATSPCSKRAISSTRRPASTP
jgi:hypothetical protein